MLNRKEFIRLAGLGSLGIITSGYSIQEENKPEFYHKPIEWKNAAKGIDFSKTNIYLKDKIVDVISAIKINPEINKIRVFNEEAGKNAQAYSIEDWQKRTGAIALINSNQYMEDPLYYPCALVICDGKQIGPKTNKYSKGIFVAEPNEEGLEKKLKKADILDFEYDNFDYKTNHYMQGVQHWPILLDRNERIRVNRTYQEAARTVIAKTRSDEILFMATEGTSLTLYNFGEILKKSNRMMNNGFNIHTAMNLDGGASTSMILKTPRINYSIVGWSKIPGVIGVFPRD